MRKPRDRKSRQKFHAFVFTDHRLYSLNARLDAIESHCVYALAGIETCPTSGKTHLQGYVYFKDSRTKGKARKLMPHVHIEPARKCPANNFLYCSKENKYASRGSIIQALKAWKLSPMLDQI